MVNVVYRISDKGNDKSKLPNATKEHCLENTIKIFGLDNIYVIADNCSKSLVDIISNHGLEYEETSLGNSGSFKYALSKVVNEYKDTDIVYMLEDDYLHVEGSCELIEEGLTIADYVTLYDHSDQYMRQQDGGSPFNHHGLHKWRIFTTKSTHWRETPSTTMTVAAYAKTFKEDYRIWMKQPRKKVPRDFITFVRLTKQTNLFDTFFLLKKRSIFAPFYMMLNSFSIRKKRLLISPIPGRSTHAEIAWLSPLVDWEQY